jgi:hypothetical protein
MRKRTHSQKTRAQLEVLAGEPRGAFRDLEKGLEKSDWSTENCHFGHRDIAVEYGRADKLEERSQR